MHKEAKDAEDGKGAGRKKGTKINAGENRNKALTRKRVEGEPGGPRFIKGTEEMKGKLKDGSEGRIGKEEAARGKTSQDHKQSGY